MQAVIKSLGERGEGGGGALGALFSILRLFFFRHWLTIFGDFFKEIAADYLVLVDSNFNRMHASITIT